jgi:hypothetical protein
LFSLLVLGLIAAAVGLMLLNNYASDIVSVAVKKQTGFPVSVGRQNVSLWKGAVEFQNLQIMNPSHFSDPSFLHFNQFKTKVDLWSLHGERIVINELVLDLDSITVVQPKGGNISQMNVSEFVSGLSGDSAGAVPNQAAAKTPPPFIIKKLTIKIGTVKYLDLGKTNPQPEVFNLNYDRTFTDVTDVNALRVALAQDFAVHGMYFLAKGFVQSLLDSKTYGEAADTIFKTGGQVLDAGQKVLQGVGGALNSIFK